MEQIKHRNLVSLWIADRIIKVVKDERELAGERWML
jgi:hypothetical protein